MHSGRQSPVSHVTWANSVRTTFMVDDWIAHTPKDVVAKNFAVDPSVFASVPAADPYILNGTGQKQPCTIRWW
jgi:hypothetical protein